MLCFTSPTIRLPCSSLWLMHSSSSTLKFCHCTVLVSWNSSIITFSRCEPIFSKMNGESVSLMSEWSRVWVSLSRKRFASTFISRTFRSMLLSRRSWLRCFSVSTADAYIFQLLLRVDSAFSRSGTMVSSAKWRSDCGAVFFVQQSAEPSSSAFCTLPVIMLSSYCPFCSLMK